MSGSYDSVHDCSSSAEFWAFKTGDLVRFSPSRRVWDYTDPWGYPVYAPSYKASDGAIGIIVERYKKYGYHSSVYYRVKWMDTMTFSNERHEDLSLISAATGPKITIE